MWSLHSFLCMIRDRGNCYLFYLHITCFFFCLGCMYLRIERRAVLCNSNINQCLSTSVFCIRSSFFVDRWQNSCSVYLSIRHHCRHYNHLKNWSINYIFVPKYFRFKSYYLNTVHLPDSLQITIQFQKQFLSWPSGGEDVNKFLIF